MIRRGLRTGGPGLSLTAAGVPVLQPALTAAQDAARTSAITTETTEVESTREDVLLQRQELADDFLAKLTANPGLSDPAGVETAFKETLTQMIDERRAAGEISANRAEELMTRIDGADSIVGLGLRGFGGPGFGPGRGGSLPPRRPGRP